MRLDVEWLGNWPRQVGYAVRSLARSPGFTAAAVLTLAVGIGATSAICIVVNTILLQPLPLLDADRLVRIVENDRPRNMPAVNYREYLDWQSRMTTLAGLAAATYNPQVVMPTPADGPGHRRPGFVELLRGARRRALLGRTLLLATPPTRRDGAWLLRVATALRIRSTGHRIRRALSVGQPGGPIAHGDRCDAGKHGNDRRAHGLLHADRRRAKRGGDPPGAADRPSS